MRSVAERSFNKGSAFKNVEPETQHVYGDLFGKIAGVIIGGFMSIMTAIVILKMIAVF